MKSKFKRDKSKKSKHKNFSFKGKQEKEDIKIDMMGVTTPLNICLLILFILTCEHYTIAL